MFILRGLRARLPKCGFRSSYARRREAFKVVHKAPRFAWAFRRSVEFAVEKIEGPIQEIGVIGPRERACGGGVRGSGDRDGIFNLFMCFNRGRWRRANGSYGLGSGRVGLWTEGGLQLGGPGFVAEGGDGFSADAGDRLQQKLGDIAEGNGVFAGDAILRQKAKDLAEGAVHSGGGGEVGGKSFELGGQGEFALGEEGEDFLLAGGVVEAEIGMMIGAQHAALALVGGKEATARRLGRGADSVSVVLVQERIDMGSGTRRRREGAVECLLCSSHMQCYREGKSASMVWCCGKWNGCGNFAL